MLWCTKLRVEKRWTPAGCPFGVVSLDGKAFSIPASDDWYAQRQTSSEDGLTKTWG
jgi:hypothetical protein